MPEKNRPNQKKEKSFLEKLMSIRGVTIRELAAVIKLSPEQTGTRIQDGTFTSKEIPDMAKFLQVKGGNLYAMIVAHTESWGEDAFKESITPISIKTQTHGKD